MDVYTILIREDDWETSFEYVGTYPTIEKVIEVLMENFDNDSILKNATDYDKVNDPKLIYKMDTRILVGSKLNTYEYDKEYIVAVYKDTLE